MQYTLKPSLKYYVLKNETKLVILIIFNNLETYLYVYNNGKILASNIHSTV